MIKSVNYYTWQVSNLKAIKLEENAEAWRILPSVYILRSK